MGVVSFTCGVRDRRLLIMLTPSAVNTTAAPVLQDMYIMLTEAAEEVVRGWHDIVHCNVGRGDATLKIKQR
jgi:hypothetical protein